MESKEIIKNVENKIHKQFGQEALEKLIKYIPREKTINSLYNKEVDELIEIIKQGLKIEEHTQPTFSECIKKWEERGWKITQLNSKTLNIHNFDSNTVIEINILSKNFRVFNCIDQSWSILSFENLELLVKTLKSLEVENDKN